MHYELEFSDRAERDLLELKKSDNSSFKKAAKLLKELQEHPTTGTGKPEQLKYDLSGKWSRRINKKDRLIYRIDEIEMKVEILSAKDHY